MLRISEAMKEAITTGEYYIARNSNNHQCQDKVRKKTFTTGYRGPEYYLHATEQFLTYHQFLSLSRI
jgi:hypothetical protein